MTLRLSRLKSYILVGIQFGTLAVLAATGPWLARHPLWLTMEIAAFVLAAWAIQTMRIRHLNVLPEVRQGSRLVREGPYRWIRHPMYAAILLGALALVLDAPSPFRWFVYAVLASDLLVKLHYEERLLAAAFPAYRAYQETSKRLIPFLY